MSNDEKKNKNGKKVATKAPKVHGVHKIPKYEQTGTAIAPPDLSPKPKKGGK
ncbi:hypothetical protein J2I47_02595 [Fibrella sp. HMF5335]|uniref:Uncharacterized protein n=1 Tax=Fibrella rubiginis TaxID=2817060 RepID=A0A939GCT9_9BACT|nr:hypothetical protein [Fibrella rubiginis]MBO0935428.1 hypothetical protein [Fibrella rubiginis]